MIAAQQPSKKDLSVLRQGTLRNHIISELGVPFSSAEQNDKKVDIFIFTQGYSKGTKAARAIFHLAADIFTFFLWELIATPGEIIFDGSERSYKVTYDQSDCVEKVEVLNGKPLPYSYPTHSGDPLIATPSSKPIVPLPIQADPIESSPSVSEQIVASTTQSQVSAAQTVDTMQPGSQIVTPVSAQTPVVVKK
ncbi:MAG: hypothetical protein HY586_03455 [Candidatus Omnitrophica bacterium]|nr:hypothetical protein [Candidatus Omnitrophota bacterium]